MKDLKDLNLLDRFLFAEAMEDPQNMRDVLEIILGKDVVLKHLPQTEKEARISPAYRFAKVDVWAKDTDEVVYDTEVQGTNTKNLPKRSRYYESIIDAKLLKPGERDFNKMNDIYIILIAPFDLFGKRKYMYTFEMTCKEDPSVSLEDGATRIFLNTHGENPDEVSPELVELLHYIEHTTQDMADGCKSERIHKMQKRICSIKSSEEVSVRYMQRWEEMEMEKERYLKYVKICERAERMKIDTGDRMGALMDIESADKKFNMRQDDWLQADDFNFAHDYCGIQNNIKRGEFPATDFGFFLPRFAGTH